MEDREIKRIKKYCLENVEQTIDSLTVGGNTEFDFDKARKDVYPNSSTTKIELEEIDEAEEIFNIVRNW